MSDSYSLGIDLGTTFTSAAVFQDGRAVVIPLAGEALTVPSVVYVTAEGQVAVGPEALRYAEHDEVGLVRHVKRRLGSSHRYLVRGKQYTPEQLTAVLLRWVVNSAEALLGSSPAHVTLTHPANWHEHRRGKLEEAAAMIGLESVGLKAEPDAAAVYHAGRNSVPTGAVLAVYDLGGGTFDATIIRKTDHGLQLAGDPTGIDNLGGIDFDNLLREHVMGQIENLTEGLDEADRATVLAMRRVDQNVVDAKIALSSEVSAAVLVDLPSGTTEILVARSEFEDLAAPLIEETVDELERALEIAEVSPADVHAVLLVGGSSRIPLISRLISSRLGCHVESADEPKVSVCLGAAITAEAVARGTIQRLNDEPAPEPPTPRPSKTPVPPPPHVSRGRSHGTLHVSGAEPSRKPRPKPDFLDNEHSIAMTVDLDGQRLTDATDRRIDVAIVSDQHVSIPREISRQRPGPIEDNGVIKPPNGNDPRPLIISAAVVALVLVVVLVITLLA